MQNKTAIWVFSILLSIACLYQLSFTLVTSMVEGDADEYASKKIDSVQTVSDSLSDGLDREIAFEQYREEYLQKMNNQEVYPILGHTYKEAKKKEINLGLDLQGGMNVTLQVSVNDLIKALSDNSNDPLFLEALQRANEMQTSSQADYITLFERAWNEVNPGGQLATVFHNRENKDKFPIDATNEEILTIIREESDAAVDRTQQVLSKRIDNLGVIQPTIQRQAGTGRIIVELPGVKDKERVRKILQGTAKLEFWETYDNGEVFSSLEKANELLKEKMERRASSDEDAADVPNEEELTEITEEPVLASNDTSLVADSATDTTEGDISSLFETDTTSASDTSEAGLAQAQADFEKENPLFAVLRPSLFQDESGQYFAGKGPTIGYASIYDTARVNELLSRRDVRSLFPRRIKFLWAAKAYDENEEFLQLYAINVQSKDGNAPLEGDVITNARVVNDVMGNPEISMTMNAEGAKTWKNMTAEASSANPKKSIAIVLDNLVYSAPRVDGEIAGGQSSISGQFTVEEAEDLANVLKAGKLPAPSKIIEEAVVGPTLGKEAINAGFISFAIALVIVLIYMAFYYSAAGFVADIALLVNLFFIMGVLSSLGATLTLPGIAGIVLTIGMSVDANVLIFERIREELRAGKGVRLAIVDGYKNAYSSILDANITTLLTGIILYVFGTGPIKGFATTLIIGIATSLFAAIFITRLIFEWKLEKNPNISFSSRMTEKVLSNVNYQFVANRRRFQIISAVVLLLGIGSIAVRGFNYGVDFTGGRSYIVRFDQVVPVDEVANILGNAFVSEDGNRVVPEVKTYGAANQMKITTKYLIEEEGLEADQLVEGKMRDGLASITPGFEIMSSQKVEPSIADDIKQAAVWAVVFSLMVIFLYIVIRFRKWQFGLGAVAALFHDVLIVLSIFSIFYGFLPFSLEIDQAFIAAILTVVGYSINDTVVVFDRVREYLGIYKRKDEEVVINDAINSTLSRTINTSMTTLVVLLMIFIFGGEVIRGFVFALIVGIIVGTYSSIFVAGNLVVDFLKKKE